MVTGDANPPPALSLGSILALFLFLVIWAGDICAYLIGRPFGRTPFFARISPRKTWEGALAGLAGSLLAAWACAHWFLARANPRTVILLAVWIAVAGQAGDLVESAIKRGANQKDSGTLLPGHGGFLDRIDSLLFGVPALWLAITLLAFFPWLTN
jgi:phosphatidate cytidylyltransferase